MALLHLEIQSPAPPEPASLRDRDGPPRKGWLVYVPLAVAVLLILLPHPSFLIMLSSFYLKTRHTPVLFWVHLLAVYGVTFLALTSLMVCVVRDPGPVAPKKSKAGAKHQTAWRSDQRDGAEDSEQVTTALLRGARDDGEDEEEGEEEGGDDQDQDQDPSAGADVDELAFAGRWCRRCCQPRPERAHHCSTCGRCVLKMDHHCPWLGGNCVGHRTYPAFLHFIFSTTLLAGYITCIALSVTVHFVVDPFSIDPRVSPLHALFLVLMGAIFTLTMGSFLIYHMYLVSTNQTTLEHMSPYLLLRYLPPPPEPATPQSLSPTGPHFPVPKLTPTQAPSHPQEIPLPKRHPPPPSSSYARPKVAPALADPPTPPDSPLDSPLFPSPPHPLQHDPTPPYTKAAHPPRLPRTALSSPYPFRTELPYRPPEEHELSSAQRRLVKNAHGQVRPYDIGFRRNWRQVFGGGRRGWRGWVLLVLCGGAPKGDGRTFEKGMRVGAGLDRLARGLDDIKRQEMRGV